MERTEVLKLKDSCSMVSRRDDAEVNLPNMTSGMLRRYLDEAAESVITGTCDSSASHIRNVIHLVHETCIRAIINAATLPTGTIKYEICNAVKHIEIDQDATPFKEENGNVSDVCSLEEDGLCNGKTTKILMEHSMALTMDVPEFAVYCIKGVRCKLCWLAMKGHNCVQRLIDHTKRYHPGKASAAFLNKIRRANSYRNLLGKGLRYCTCAICIRVGIARWDERFDDARARKGNEKK